MSAGLSGRRRLGTSGDAGLAPGAPGKGLELGFLQASRPLAAVVRKGTVISRRGCKPEEIVTWECRQRDPLASTSWPGSYAPDVCCRCLGMSKRQRGVLESHSPQQQIHPLSSATFDSFSGSFRHILSGTPGWADAEARGVRSFAFEVGKHIGVFSRIGMDGVGIILRLPGALLCGPRVRASPAARRFRTSLEARAFKCFPWIKRK